MAVMLIARFDGDVDQLRQAYDRAHALIMSRGGATGVGELRHHCAIGVAPVCPGPGPGTSPARCLTCSPGQARSRSGGGRPRPGRWPLEQEGTTAGQLPARYGRLLISCLRAACQELKFAIAGAQPTP